MAATPQPTHYDTLNVDRDATGAQIKAAWRTISRATHPDMVGDDRALEQYLAAKTAYETLSDTAAKAGYDRHLDSQQRKAQLTAPAGPVPPEPDPTPVNHASAPAPSRRRRQTPAYLAAVMLTIVTWMAVRVSSAGEAIYTNADPSGLRSAIYQAWTTGKIYSTVAVTLVALTFAWRARHWYGDRSPAVRVAFTAVAGGIAVSWDLVGTSLFNGAFVAGMGAAAILPVASEFVRR